MSWEKLKEDDDYEIYTDYPYYIRKKIDKTIISESINHYGYYRCTINDKTYLKHRLIALQFIPNDDPEHKTQVDHINRLRNDNRIENLRWCTPCENSKNKSSYNRVKCEYVDEIPEESIEINEYGQHIFDNLYYCDDIFYIYNGIRYRKLHVMKRKGCEFYYVQTKDIDNKQVTIYYTTFKKMYNLMY